MAVELNRYKGQFLKGNPKKIKPPVDNDRMFYDTKFQVTNCSFSHNGWIPPKRGAL